MLCWISLIFFILDSLYKSIFARKFLKMTWFFNCIFLNFHIQNFIMYFFIYFQMLLFMYCLKCLIPRQDQLDHLLLPLIIPGYISQGFCGRILWLVRILFFGCGKKRNILRKLWIFSTADIILCITLKKIPTTKESDTTNNISNKNYTKSIIVPFNTLSTKHAYSSSLCSVCLQDVGDHVCPFPPMPCRSQ